MSRLFYPRRRPQAPRPRAPQAPRPATPKRFPRERRRCIGSSLGPKIAARRERPNYYDFVTVTSTACADARRRHNILWRKMYNFAVNAPGRIDSIGRVGAAPARGKFSLPASPALLSRAFRAGQARSRVAIVRARARPPRRRLGNAMKHFLLRFFTWWNGATLNTLWHTRRHGELVGQDEFGNPYYRTRGGAMDPALGFERRWVIYNGVSEASMTPPGWNGWLHHTVDVAAERGRLQGPRLGEARIWPTRPERRAAIRPKGSTMGAAGARRRRGDYQAWTPGGLTPRLHFARLCRQGSPMRLSARQIPCSGPESDDERTNWLIRRLAALPRRRCWPPARRRSPTRSSIRPRSSPGSTRSPAESSRSRSRSTKRCNSARCRSRRASATRARRPRRRRPTFSPKSTKSPRTRPTHRIFTGWMFADSPGHARRRAPGLRHLADRL